MSAAVAPEPAASARSRLAGRVLAAALFGLRDALEDDKPRDAVVEEAPEPSDEDWLIWLDQDDAARSLIIVPRAGERI
ncbi:MAG: hypothetical protein GEV08_17925 [Acidimicrobiia bacterium]|nr:hypothetical protein [Acidimicrobiia bacterium]